MHLISPFLLKSGILSWLKVKSSPLLVSDLWASSCKGRICTNLSSSHSSVQTMLSFLREIEIQGYCRSGLWCVDRAT